jgi:hypothetical protein
VPQKNQRDRNVQTGMDRLKSDPKLRENGASPQQGLTAMATLIGMARHMVPHFDPVDSPSGLMGMLKAPTSSNAQSPSSDGQRFSLDLNQGTAAGGAVGGMKSPIGTPGGPLQNSAKLDANNQAMQAIGSLADTTSGGLGAKLGSAGEVIKHQMNWLQKGAKELYNIERK